MTPKQFLLLKLGEKCNLASVACQKAMQYGLDGKFRPAAYTTFQDDISNRLNDVRAILQLLNEAGVELPIDRAEIERAKERLTQSLLAAVDRRVVAIDRKNHFG